MLKYPVSKEKELKLLKRMKKLDIQEEDIIETFIRGSGSGGQKINKTSSCVQLKHLPTGLEVKCQKDRSQAMNRFHARRELCEKVATVLFNEKTKKEREKERIRRQKKRRSRKQKEKILAEKKKVSQKKEQRKPIKSEE